MRFRVFVVVAALIFTGCNANQEVNLSSQPPSQVFAGHYVDYNPYNPISYAQNTPGIAAAAANLMPTIDLTDDELAAVTAAIRRLIDEDRFSPCATPRPAALRFRKARRRAKANTRPTTLPKTPPPTRGGKPARR